MLKQKKNKRQSHKLRYYLNRAGIYTNEKNVRLILFDICILINFLVSILLLDRFATKPGITLVYVLFIMFLLWVLIFPILLIIVWVFFFVFVDIKTYKRRIEIENVLADYLQLVASNVRAGMTLDKALWYAVRPRFGILAREIETTAKETLAGIDINNAMIRFSERYDSKILSRTVSLILEGLNSGGNMADLINKIALDIDESRILQKEMSANVSNYAIFIGFASIFAAPVLFALAHQFIIILQNLSKNIVIPKGIGPFSGISFSGSISSQTFVIFAIISLCITSFFSSLIIATIKKGDIRNSIRYIPTFLISTLILFYLLDIALNLMLSNFF